MNKQLVVALACVLLAVLTACAGPGAYVKSTGGDWVQEVNLTANGYYVIYFRNNHDLGFCTRDAATVTEAEKARDGKEVVAGVETGRKISGGIYVFYHFRSINFGDPNGALLWGGCPAEMDGYDIVYLEKIERFDPGEQGAVTSIFGGFLEQLSRRGSRAFFVP